MNALKLLMIAFLFVALLTACSGAQSDVSTKNYILTTGFEGGELVYLGVGGDINGMINPTLEARPGETITVMLVNGGEGKHDFFIPDIKAKSQSVTEKGESVSVTLTVPNKEVELEYYDSVANHADIGMLGVLHVSNSAVPSSPRENSNQPSDQAVAQPASQNQDTGAGEQVFKQKCASCHTIGGGKLVGPDLEGVGERRDVEWIESFISAPDKMIASGDPIITELLAEYNNLPMPNLGLTEQEVDDLLAYLVPQEEAAPQEPVKEQAGPAEPAAPAAPQPPSGAAAVLASDSDPAYGEYLFTGVVSLQNGGTPCIACHSVEGVGIAGGGALGPDLTHVYTRYGQQGLAAALGGLPFPSMQGIFGTRQLTVTEQADLLAFFAEADQRGEPRTQQNFQLIFGAGSGLAVAFFVVMLFFWPRQRMSLSQRLRKNGKL